MLDNMSSFDRRDSITYEYEFQQHNRQRRKSIVRSMFELQDKKHRNSITDDIIDRLKYRPDQKKCNCITVEIIGDRYQAIRKSYNEQNNLTDNFEVTNKRKQRNFFRFSHDETATKNKSITAAFRKNRSMSTNLDHHKDSSSDFIPDIKHTCDTNKRSKFIKSRMINKHISVNGDKQAIQETYEPNKYVAKWKSAAARVLLVKASPEFEKIFYTRDD